MVVTLTDGRAAAYQWDVDRRVQLDVDARELMWLRPADVDYADDTAIAQKLDDGSFAVPNLFLQSGAGQLLCWARLVDHTVSRGRLTVRPMARPEDYAYTETQVRTWGQLDEQILAEIESLEHRAASGEFDGAPGPAPRINASGNWEVLDPSGAWVDTGIPATGPRGATGEAGPPGVTGPQGPEGPPGKDGASMELDATLTAAGAAADAKATGDAIAQKQDKLTEGENITIDGNVISATGGGTDANYSMQLSNKLFIDQFVGTLKSYYNNRKDGDGKNIFTYGHNTALDEGYQPGGNQIDCSSFVGLGLLGVDFGSSPYASLGAVSGDLPDDGNDSGSGNESDEEALGVNTKVAAGSYPWVIDFRDIYYKKVNTEYPVRTASQMCQMMQEAGWAIKFAEDFRNVRRGDIVFYAKYDPDTGEWAQPSRYKHVSHVAVVSSVYENDGTYGIDSKYPYKHTMLEVSTFGGVILNTSLEKRTPDMVAAVMRPAFGAVSAADSSGSTKDRCGTLDIDEISTEGVYFLYSANTGTAPDGVSSFAGSQLEVKRAYNKWGRLYNITQMLTVMSTSSNKGVVNESKPKVFVRSNYCYAGGTYAFRKDFWSGWLESGSGGGSYDDTELRQMIAGKQPIGDYALRNEVPGVDTTLTVSGAAADAKATGDAIAQKRDISSSYDKATVDSKLAGKQDTLTAGENIKIEGDAISAELDGYVKNTDYATNTEFGIARFSANGFSFGSDGQVILPSPTTSNISSRLSNRAVTLNKLDDCVRAALCDGKGSTWTAAEQTAAQQLIGILSSEGVGF